SPLSLIWGWTSSLHGGERQLFPGLTIVALVALGLVAAARPRARGPKNRVTSVLLGIAALFALFAASAVWRGPWRLGPLWVGAAFKPFSLAFYAAAAALLASAPVRAAFRRQSAFAFYVLAAAALFVFSWGPKPAFLHQQFLYEPPYAWLMQ